MRLFSFEIKKIMSSYAIWGFIILCLAFNALVIISDGTDGYTNFMPEPQNVFDGYNTGEIAEAYIGVLGVSGGIAEDIRAKYAALQTVTDEKAVRGDSLSPYFGDNTYMRHKKLFGSVMTALSREGVLLAVLAMLFAIGHENINRTEQVVYSTKTGRRIAAKKFMAAVVAGVCAYLLLTALTLALYFALTDYKGVWGSNVSSCFNGIMDIVTGFRPFATWQSFTVLSYLLAVIGLSLGVILCFSLAGFAAGSLIRNSYAVMIMLFIIGVLCVAVPMILPNDAYAKYISVLTPVWLLLKQPLWFTDGGIDVLWRSFETVGVCLSLMLLAVLAVIVNNRFRKKDII